MGEQAKQERPYADNDPRIPERDRSISVSFETGEDPSGDARVTVYKGKKGRDTVQLEFRTMGAYAGFIISLIEKGGVVWPTLWDMGPDADGEEERDGIRREEEAGG